MQTGEKTAINVSIYLSTSIEARLRQASLLRRFSEGSGSVRSLYCGSCFGQRALLFSSGHLETKRHWNALTRHLASQVSISEHASSAFLAENVAGDSLGCFKSFNNVTNRANRGTESDN